jgi:hypothetical protein
MDKTGLFYAEGKNYNEPMGKEAPAAKTQGKPGTRYLYTQPE